MLMDIRTMSVRQVFKAHEKEVTSLCWHPETDSLLASGGYDSQLNFWDTQGMSKPIKSIHGAHEGPIWSLSWHPLGHLLVSGSHDYSTRFWSRARPGDKGFEELLPKKIAAPGDLTAKDLPPPPTIPQVVLDSGVFAGKPPKEPPASSVIMEGGKDPVRLALDNEPAQPASGLSLGDKEILDTSDFDALEEIADNLVGKAPAPTVIENKVTKAAEADVVGSTEAVESTEAAASDAPAGKAKAKAEASSAKPQHVGKAFTKAAPARPPTADEHKAKAAAEDAEDSSSGAKRAAPDADAEAEASTEADAKKPRTAEEAEQKDS